MEICLKPSIATVVRAKNRKRNRRLRRQSKRNSNGNGNGNGNRNRRKRKRRRNRKRKKRKKAVLRIKPIKIHLFGISSKLDVNKNKNKNNKSNNSNKKPSKEDKNNKNNKNSKSTSTRNSKNDPQCTISLLVDRRTYEMDALRREIYRKFEIAESSEILFVYNDVLIRNLQKTFYDFGINNNSCLLICASETVEFRQLLRKSTTSYLLGQKEDNSDSDNEKDDSKDDDNHDHDNNNPNTDMSLFMRAQGQEQGKQNVLYLDNSESEAKQEFDLTRFELVRNASHFQTQFVSGLDIFTYERSKKCVRMPCGHVMTKETLYEYSMSQLAANNGSAIVIKCPHLMTGNDNHNNHNNNNRRGRRESANHRLCAQVWDFPLIRKILIPMTEQEKRIQMQKEQQQRQQQLRREKRFKIPPLPKKRVTTLNEYRMAKALKLKASECKAVLQRENHMKYWRNTRDGHLSYLSNIFCVSLCV